MLRKRIEDHPSRIYTKTNLASLRLTRFDEVHFIIFLARQRRRQTAARKNYSSLKVIVCNVPFNKFSLPQESVVPMIPLSYCIHQYRVQFRSCSCSLGVKLPKLCNKISFVSFSFFFFCARARNRIYCCSTCGCRRFLYRLVVIGNKYLYLENLFYLKCLENRKAI